MWGGLQQERLAPAKYSSLSFPYELYGQTRFLKQAFKVTKENIVHQIDNKPK